MKSTSSEDVSIHAVSPLSRFETTAATASTAPAAASGAGASWARAGRATSAAAATAGAIRERCFHAFIDWFLG